MSAMNGVIRRRSQLPALAALAALLAAAALTLTPARADVGEVPLDSEALPLPPNLELVLELVDDSDNIIQTNPFEAAGEVKAYLTFTGPEQTQDNKIDLEISGGSLRANTDWGRTSGSRLAIREQTIDTAGCNYIQVAAYNGDPDSSDYGEADDDFSDDINRCEIDLNEVANMDDAVGKFNVYEGDPSFNIIANVMLAMGERAHTTVAHIDGGLTSDDDHYPRTAVTLQASLAVTVAEVKEVDTVSLALASTCGERQDHRGTINRGSRTAECQSTIPAQGGRTTLTLSILNEHGKAAGSGSVASALISSTRGALSTADRDLGACSANICQLVVSELTASNSANIPIVIVHDGSTGAAVVSVALLDAQGNDFAVEPVEIVFAGPPVSLEIGEASTSLTDRATAEDDNTDKLRLTVKSVDKSGNSVQLTRRAPRAVITGPDGQPVTAGIKTDWTANNAFAVADGSTVVNIEATAPAEKPLAAGRYTLELRTAGLTDTQTFIVSGPPAAVAIGEPQGSLAIGSQITITAAVTDANGNSVADGTPVSWSAAAVATTGNRLTGLNRPSNVMNGVSTARYLILSSGQAFLTVNAGGASDVKLLTLGAAAAPSPADSLSAKTPGFQSYVGFTDTTASELIADLSGIGGVLLHKDGEWIRYSVAAGRVVPGSEDFKVTRGNVLWLSSG